MCHTFSTYQEIFTILRQHIYSFRASNGYFCVIYRSINLEKHRWQPNSSCRGMNIEDVPPLFISEITVLIREAPSTPERIQIDIEDRMQPILLFIFVVALWNNTVEGFSRLYDGLKNIVRHVSGIVSRCRK
jgi:hypothetical protein